MTRSESQLLKLILKGLNSPPASRLSEPTTDTGNTGLESNESGTDEFLLSSREISISKSQSQAEDPSLQSFSRIGINSLLNQSHNTQNIHNHGNLGMYQLRHSSRANKIDFTKMDTRKIPEESQGLLYLTQIDNFVHDISSVLSDKMPEFFSLDQNGVFPCEKKDPSQYLLEIFTPNLNALHEGSVFNGKDEALFLLTIHFGLLKNTLYLNRGRLQRLPVSAYCPLINQEVGFSAKCFLCGLQLFQINQIGDTETVVITLLDKHHRCSFPGILSVIRRINFREKDMGLFISKVLTQLNVVVNSSNEFDKLEMIRYYLLAQERNLRFHQLTKIIHRLLLESVNGTPDYETKCSLIYESLLTVMVSMNDFDDIRLRNHLMNLGVVDKECYVRRIDGIKERIKKILREPTDISWKMSEKA